MDLSQCNEQQKAALKQFRETFKNVKLPEESDVYLLRWLIARQFDLANAEKMLRNSLEWRRQYRVDYILDEFKSPEVLTKYFPAGFVGQDKMKHPLWVVRYGLSDMKGILHAAKKRDYLTHVVQLVERNLHEVRSNPAKYEPKRGDSMVQSTIIFDMEGFSMKHITYKPAMDTAIQLIQLYEANYPEMLRKVFVINAPKVFSIAFSMMKPFLHERTKNKISIYSHEPSVWKAALLVEIDADQLPACYGGTMTDPDGNPHCITKVNLGGTVPKEYYFSNQPHSDIANKKTLSLSSGSKEQIEVPVKENGSLLRWEFYSENGDVAFAVYRKEGGETITEVPRDRVDSHISAEEGEIRCDSGLYVVEFDNSFSYLTSKKVFYALTVERAPNVDANANGTDL